MQLSLFKLRWQEFQPKYSGSISVNVNTMEKGNDILISLWNDFDFLSRLVRIC